MATQAKSEKNLEKNMRGRPAIGRGLQINTMVRPNIAEAIDAWAAAQPDRPTRSEAVRRLLAIALGAGDRSRAD
jgi:hypothetical protein